MNRENYSIIGKKFSKIKKQFFLHLALMLLVGTASYGQFFESKILPNDGEANIHFGWAVDMSGDYALIGSPQNNAIDPRSGAAYIFKREGSSWVQKQKLIPGIARDIIGRTVAISGDYSVIGSPAASNSSGTGVIYIYNRLGEVWNLQQTIIGPSAGARFGHHTSISGDYLLVGASGVGSNTGAAYMYKRTGTTWQQEAVLTASSGSIIRQFGEAVSTTGDYSVVGNWLGNDLGSSSGAVYIFERNGVNWSQQIKLTEPNGAANHWFGHSVSISGNQLLIGTPLDDDNGLRSGSAYIYENNGTSWVFQSKLLPSDGASEAVFGWSVDLSGDKAIIGALSDENGQNSGSAYVFEKINNTWVQTDKITATNSNPLDQFGYAVAISENYALAGAYQDDEVSSNNGAAYIFDLDLQRDSLGGELFRKQMIVQLDTADFPLMERQELRDSFQATVLDTCLCGQLELWELPQDLVLEGVPLIDIKDRRKAIKKKTKVEDAGGNYLVNFTDFTADRFQDNNGFTTNNLVENISTEVRVAVLDSGVDDLNAFSNLFWQSPYNTGAGDENCMDDPAGFDFVNNSAITLDTVGHGTAVTGRIVNAAQGGLIDDPTEFEQAIIDSLEIVNAKVYAGDRGTLWNLLCGLYYARDADVDIVNCSMGYSGEESSILRTAMRALQDSCILVVASAGNDSLDNDAIPHWPSGFAMDNIVSVAAVNGFNSTKLSTYSNFGARGVHIAYPGTIGALQPTGSISFKKGTSYSSAAVTGIAARLKMHKPEASYLDLRNALLGGVRVSTPRLEVSTGGILDYPTALQVLNTQEAAPCICLPIIECKNGTIDLSEIRNSQINASIFNNGSSSNCATGGLIYSFSSDEQQSQTMTISCDDIGTQLLNFYVTDEGGNQDFCQVTLVVTDANNTCSTLKGCGSDGNLYVAGNIDSGDYKAMNTLSSDGKISSGTTVNFISAGSITLQAGFEAVANSNFQARIDAMACENLVKEPASTNRNLSPNEPLKIEKDSLKPAIKVQVLPNPFSGRTTIQYELSASTHQFYMAIFDISGRKLKELQHSDSIEKGIYSIELEAIDWQRGMYFLGIRTENQTITKKLVVLESY